MSGKLMVLLTAVLIIPQLTARNMIEWEHTDGAAYYTVEIRQNGRIVSETRTEHNALPFFLPAGDYEFQIRVFSAFETVISETPPAPLQIADAPQITAVAVSGSLTHLRVSLSSPLEPGWYFLLKNDRAGLLRPDVVSAGLNADLGFPRPAPGLWDLVLTGPDGPRQRLEAVMDVPPPAVKIEEVFPKIITPGQETVWIKVSGAEGGGRVTLPGLAVSPSDMRNGIYEFSPDAADSGWFPARAQNSSGEESFKKRAFYITKAAARGAEHFAYRYSLFLGWNTSGPVLSDFVYGSLTGFSAGFSAKAGQSRRNPPGNGLHFDVILNLNHARNTYDAFRIDTTTTALIFGFSYVTSFRFPVNLLLRAGAGGNLTVYTSPEYSRGVIAPELGDSLKNLDSFDFTAQAASGLRISFSERLYMDTTIGLTGIFYKLGHVFSVQPRIEAGWRW